MEPYMTLEEKYNNKVSQLSLGGNNIPEPSSGQAAFGFYSEKEGVSTAEYINLEDSRLHYLYSYQFYPNDLKAATFNKGYGEDGLPIFDTSLDDIDPYRPRNYEGIKTYSSFFNNGYKSKGPRDGYY